MVRGRRKTFVKVAVAAALSASLCLGTVNVVEAKHHKDTISAWLSGDFHQHTLYTDGSTTFDFVMEKNNEFGLDWWANSEHGGCPQQGRGRRLVARQPPSTPKIRFWGTILMPAICTAGRACGTSSTRTS